MGKLKVKEANRMYWPAQYNLQSKCYHRNLKLTKLMSDKYRQLRMHDIDNYKTSPERPN